LYLWIFLLEFASKILITFTPFLTKCVTKVEAITRIEADDELKQIAKYESITLPIIQFPVFKQDRLLFFKEIPLSFSHFLTPLFDFVKNYKYCELKRVVRIWNIK
jgi:hypothetical protein